jgi:hypothetical protein
MVFLFYYFLMVFIHRAVLILFLFVRIPKFYSFANSEEIKTVVNTSLVYVYVHCGKNILVTSSLFSSTSTSGSR